MTSIENQAYQVRSNKNEIGVRLFLFGEISQQHLTAPQKWQYHSLSLINETQILFWQSPSPLLVLLLLLLAMRSFQPFTSISLAACWQDVGSQFQGQRGSREGGGGRGRGRRAGGRQSGGRMGGYDAIERVIN